MRVRAETVQEPFQLSGTVYPSLNSTVNSPERITGTPPTGRVFDQNILLDQILDIAQRGIM
jgi:hypothetical protein